MGQFIAFAIIGSLLLLNLIGYIITKIISPRDLIGIAPRGRPVDVHGKRMHVYAKGEPSNGRDTIVLLPGLNVVLPSVDYKPLMDALADEYNVVTVEYFGYGFSDPTDTPRTNANYTEEIRTALREAGFPPPYILLPYSASGIYAEYYANKFPHEVKALILLDTTSSAEKDAATPPRWVFNITKLQQATGFMRPINRLALAKGIGLTAENGYTPQDIREVVAFANRAFNDTLINQNMDFAANVDEVLDMRLPPTLPILVLRAGDYEKGKWLQYANKHAEKLGAQTVCHFITGSTHGTIYHDRTHRDAVCARVRAFLRGSSCHPTILDDFL